MQKSWSFYFPICLQIQFTQFFYISGFFLSHCCYFLPRISITEIREARRPLNILKPLTTSSIPLITLKMFLAELAPLRYRLFYLSSNILSFRPLGNMQQPTSPINEAISLILTPVVWFFSQLLFQRCLKLSSLTVERLTITIYDLSVQKVIHWPSSQNLGRPHLTIRLVSLAISRVSDWVGYGGCLSKLTMFGFSFYLPTWESWPRRLHF